MHISTTTPAARGLVSVRADAGDPKAVLAELKTAFEAFRREHEEQIKEIRSGFDDVVKAEKVERINEHISELQAYMDDLAGKVAAAQIGAPGGDTTPEQIEYAKAFERHIRKGGDAEIRALIDAGKVNAAMVEGTDAEGGYMAPVEWDRTITSRMVTVSPVRQIARIVTISTAGFRKLYNTGGTTVGWVGETDARPQTGTPRFSEQEFRPMELYAMPAATQTLLDDAEIDLAAWLADEVSEAFAEEEGRAFVTGDGVNKPKGLLTYSSDTSHPLGAIGTVNSGDADTITPDSLIDILYDLPRKFRSNAAFIMNRKTQAVIRKFKDADGNYLWQPSMAAGQPATLLGYPVIEIEDMPDVAAGTVPIMFGNFRAGYMIVDRIGIRIMRDPFTQKPYVLFYTTKRVGGGVTNPEALRYLKVAA